MNESKTRSVRGHFPTFGRLLGWLFGRLLSWRMIRRCLFVLICLLTLLALYYAEENWRGQRAWKSYRQELEADGGQLDYRAFIPKPVPEEQNFAATPFVRSWFEKRNSDEQWFAKDNYSKAGSMVKPVKYKAEYVDLVAWGTAFAAVRSGQHVSNRKLDSVPLDLDSRVKAAPG